MRTVLRVELLPGYRHDLLLMVDEAHSSGVLGRTGRGVVERAGLPPKSVDIHIGTLSKALAGCRGYIAGDAGLVEYRRYLAPGFIVSVGLSPADTAAALAAVEILDGDSELARGWRGRIRLFRRIPHDEDLPVIGDAASPIASLVIGDQIQCPELPRRLIDAGIHVPLVLPPVVAEGSARLRFFLTLHHSTTQIKAAVRFVARELRAVPISKQPSERP